jgi:NAD(P) transhydrogenase
LKRSPIFILNRMQQGTGRSFDMVRSLLLLADRGYYPRPHVQYDYDLVVLGSGPAGERAAVTAALMGKRVIVIEREKEPGGAAVHTGTLPSKTLRETAVFLSGREQREVYGVGVTIDEHLFVPKLLSRKAAVKKLEVERILAEYEQHDVRLMRGHASVSGPHEVTVALPDGAVSKVTGEFLLIATGSVPHRPAEIPWDQAEVEDSDTILQLDNMPPRMVILGAGVIGCEYASIFGSLGCKVTLVDKRDELLPFLDRDMSEALRVAFVEMGIDVRLKEAQDSIIHDGDALAVKLAGGSTVLCDKVLFCGGRSGRTAGLGLEAVGVKMGPRGSVAVNERYVSSVPSILAVGDVIGFPALASTSMEQGRVAVSCAFESQGAACAVAQILPYGIYTIPEVACVGLSEEDAIAAGRRVVAGHGHFDKNARAKINGLPGGFMKLVFDQETRVLIGAHAIGDRATELIHIGQIAVVLRGTVDDLSTAVFNYPTLSECVKYAARDALSHWPS